MSATEYHKIQTVWLRDPATNHKTLIPGAWARPEFEYLRGLNWVFTEKVDGTNIRIILKNGASMIGGKTDDAQIPSFLIGRLREIGDAAVAAGLVDMVLYGEGYGAKIQKGGGNYLDRADFVLFDIWSAPDIWLERANVDDIGAKLGLKVVPILAAAPIAAAIEMARVGFNSQWGPFPAEGLVMRPRVELRDRRGERVITKIKTKDFAMEQRTLRTQKNETP